MSEKCEFIDAQYAGSSDEENAPTITRMCEWLEVPRSSYYDWLSRPESETAKRMELLKIKIEALFYANNEEYGYRRIHAALVRGGEQADDETVRKLMRELGLEPCQPRPWRHSLTEQGPSGPIPDLVNRDFTASLPGAKMVGDISAPRGALPYRPRSGRRQEEVSSGLMAYLEPKGEGDHSTPGNREPRPGVRGDVPGGPRNTAKALNA